ncbi:MAG: hypothetical protein QXE81_03335 [Desulfurococcaceae archaeon]
MDPWLHERISLLSQEFKHFKTLDSFLVKLSSLVYDLEDHCFGDVDKAKELFKDALSHPLMTEHISLLSCYRDLIESQIQRDPRLKKLREYNEILTNALSRAPCKETRELTTMREATFRIEKKEEIKEIVEKPRQFMRRDFWVKVSIAVGVALIVLALIILLQRFI